MFLWLKLLKFDVTKTENSYNKVVYYLIISDVNIVSCVFFFFRFFFSYSEMDPLLKRVLLLSGKILKLEIIIVFSFPELIFKPVCNFFFRDTVLIINKIFLAEWNLMNKEGLDLMSR